MFRLAHLSDIHLGPLPDVRYRDLASKRITGYVNWHRNRRRHLGEDTLSRVCADIETHAPDHIALTGDLVNLALDTEIETAKRWLEGFGSGHDVSVVPGNHDAYVPGALDKACRAWSPWMTGDGANAPAASKAFPYMRVRDQVALIGVSSARASAPFLATGYFRKKQARRLSAMLEEAGERGLYRVVMIHHPPLRHATPSHKRLYGISLFQKTVLKAGAELVLHGHTHLPTLGWICGKGKAIPVAGVQAGGQGPGGRKPPAGWNLFEISGEAGNWHTRLIRRAIEGAAIGMCTLSSEELAAPVTSKSRD
ncbi:MAG: metallophosphoesterase [Notoacmeibacter sp.]|nr:metallophosphoesterase [Notoacmeibacter sp.]